MSCSPKWMPAHHTSRHTILHHASEWHPPGSRPGLAPPYPHPALLPTPATRPHTRRRVQVSTIPAPHWVFQTRQVPVSRRQEGNEEEFRDDVAHAELPILCSTMMGAHQGGQKKVVPCAALPFPTAGSMAGGDVVHAASFLVSPQEQADDRVCRTPPLAGGSLGGCSICEAARIGGTQAGEEGEGERD
jgi:hypothetical protein